MVVDLEGRRRRLGWCRQAGTVKEVLGVLQEVRRSCIDQVLAAGWASWEDSRRRLVEERCIRKDGRKRVVVVETWMPLEEIHSLAAP